MTQEFVTLPREVVEQAIDALYCTDSEEGSPAYNFELKAIEELRAALEQPQVVREAAPNGATHIQPQQGAFYKRVDEKWYVWSRMEDGRPHRWYISPGTVESCLKPISAATERLQNHVPDAGNMVPAGWKLVPVEPTVEMMDAGGAATRRCYQHLNKGEVMCSYVYRHMLDAAPQPPVVGQSDNDTVPVPRSLLGAACAAINRKQDAPKLLEQLRRYTTGDLSTPAAAPQQGEQEPSYLDGGSRYKVTHVKTSGYCIIGLPGELLGCWVALVDATDNKHIDGPQPKREPLTDEWIEKICPSFDDPMRREMWKIGFKAVQNIK